MTARAVVFDLDGLMLDTEPGYKAAWQRAAADLGYQLRDSLYHTLIGRSEPDSEAELTTAFGKDFSILEFRSRWTAHWRAQVEEKSIPTKEGLLELLGLLEEQHTPFAVATSSDQEKAAFSLHCAGLDHRIPIVISADQVARGKPAPDIFLAAARRLDVDPRECVALEDSDAGVESAVRAGMTALMIPDLQHPSGAAVQLAFRVLHSLREATPVLLGLLSGELSA